MKFNFYEINRLTFDVGGLRDVTLFEREENILVAKDKFLKILGDEIRTAHDWNKEITRVELVLSKFEIEIKFNSLDDVFEVENVEEVAEILMEDITL